MFQCRNWKNELVRVSTLIVIQTASAGTPRVMRAADHKGLSMENMVRFRLLSKDNRYADSSSQRTKNVSCHTEMEPRDIM